MIRRVLDVWPSVPTMEGAGVRLRRAFGRERMPRLDPFLLLDDFRGSDPSDYIAGFPWHPHRGIETITYMLEGRVEHGDSLGNQGIIEPGDVQWMTAGSGIVHQEMPKPNADGRMGGFQLWANLPAAQKMMEPRYRDVLSKDIPVIETDSGATIRIVSGTVEDTEGPVRDIVTQPEYLDVCLSSESQFEHEIAHQMNAMAYVFEGAALFDPEQLERTTSDHLILWGEGDRISIRAGEQGARFLLISGKPIGEPIAWRGPIVMNTDEELSLAFEEYRAGTFLKHQ